MIGRRIIMPGSWGMKCLTLMIRESRWRQQHRKVYKRRFTEDYSGKHIVKMLLQEIPCLNANTVAGCTARQEPAPT